MPRFSPFYVVLTDEEERYLQETARKYTSPYCDVIRAKVVLLAAEGQKNTEIAARRGFEQERGPWNRSRHVSESGSRQAPNSEWNALLTAESRAVSTSTPVTTPSTNRNHPLMI
jgi:hypothetical protein